MLRLYSSQGEFMAKARPIPEGYHNVTPYLVIQGAAAAIDFYEKAFGAVEVMRMPQPDGRVGHAELKFGDSHVMMADEFPEMTATAPAPLKIPGDINGPSRCILRMSLRKRWNAAWRPKRKSRRHEMPSNTPHKPDDY